MTPKSMDGWRKSCFVCRVLSQEYAKSLKEKPTNYRERQILHEQMRDHINRTKYPQRHGFVESITGRI